WEYWALGRGLLVCGQEELARDYLRTAAEQSPDRLWPHYYLAHCEHRLGREEEALAAAQICVALAPRRAECFDLRGIIREALGETSKAKSDFDRALTLDPKFTAAAEHLASLNAVRSSIPE